MKNILLIISLFLLLSSCSIGGNMEKNENNIKEDVKLEDTNNQNQKSEEKQTKEEESLKDIENKEVIDTNKGGDTSIEETGTADTTEEEIVKEFENELDDLFKSLEGYE